MQETGKIGKQNSKCLSRGAMWCNNSVLCGEKLISKPICHSRIPAQNLKAAGMNRTKRQPQLELCESVVQSQLSLCHQGDFGLFLSKKRGITFAHQLITVIDKAQTCGVIYSFYAHIEKFILLFSCFEAGPSCFLALCYADFHKPLQCTYICLILLSVGSNSIDSQDVQLQRG